MQTTTPAPAETKIVRRNAITLKLLFIGALVLLLQIPLHWVNVLREERSQHWSPDANAPMVAPVRFPAGATAATEGYRMVERAVKHGLLVLALVFAAFFLFEVLAGLRLHPVHYGLVGAALCLFYLALLALAEAVAPGPAYVGAAGASSLLIVLYSVSILRSRGRALVIGALLTAVHGVLYVVLRMENHALLAGTSALFAALGAVMYFSRNIDWFAEETGRPASR